MIIAGISALWELDIKKIVALSTLSQVGLIITCIGLGFYDLALFHLLTHAFFKALLFITVGNIIHLSADFQDLRKIALSPSRLPTSLAFSLVANASLCGLPFIAGFYSKDLIFELALLTPLNL
jgi:NADH-ubiquinone oxidoreductase chain 5